MPQLPSIWTSKIVLAVAVGCSAIALNLAACGEDDTSDVGEIVPSPREEGVTAAVAEVRRLAGGDRAVDRRPAACRTTHAVLVVNGKPNPARVTVGPGDCVVWGNTTAYDVSVSSAKPQLVRKGKRVTGAIFGFAFTLFGRSAGGSVGPFTRLTPAEAYRQTVADHAPKARRQLPPVHASYAYASTRTPVEVRYAVRPSGAHGTLILMPGGRAPVPTGRVRLSGDVRKVRGLRDGRRVVDERPAACQSTYAVLITDSAARPARLRVKAGGCVVWGNLGRSRIAVASRQECAPDRPCVSFAEPIGPGEAGRAIGPLKRALEEIPYTVTRAGKEVARGTIIIDPCAEPSPTPVPTSCRDRRASDELRNVPRSERPPTRMPATQGASRTTS